MNLTPTNHYTVIWNRTNDHGIVIEAKTESMTGREVNYHIAALAKYDGINLNGYLMFSRGHDKWYVK